MKYFITISCVVLYLFISSGCATHSYDINTCEGMSNKNCANIKISSRLEFKEVSADYERDDTKIEFHFRASEVAASPLIDKETVEAFKEAADVITCIQNPLTCKGEE
jgi:hypothetical protein